MIQPAERLNLVSEYYFSRKLKEVAQLNAEGKDIISLAIGSPDMPPSEQTIEKLCEVARQPNAHGYQPTMGTPELRQAMAGFYKRFYNVNLDPAKEVLPLIGSKEGILHVTLAFVNPGDEVLVPNPGYPTYTSLSKILGAKIVNYNLRPENGWQPDFDELEKMDLTRVRLMWTNYPNMPTGAPARMETYERLVRFAQDHHIVVVNDNPYSFILNDKPLSLLQVPGAKDCCIEFNSMSKSHNMPGWRASWLLPRPTTTPTSGIAWQTSRPMPVAANMPSRSWMCWVANTTRTRWACSSGAESLTHITTWKTSPSVSCTRPASSSLPASSSAPTVNATSASPYVLRKRVFSKHLEELKD